MKINEIDMPLIFSRISLSGINPLILSKKTVSVIGLGGLGVLVAEMLARVGIGKLILIDRDMVSLENLNRLGYNFNDLNKPKVEALKEKLNGIIKARENFELELETYFVDIIAWDGLKDVVKKSDLILTCLDNIEARLEVNYWTVKYKKPLIDGGTSLNGLRGRVITVLPFNTACLECYYDKDSLLKLDDDGSELNCGASLPTTMAMVAAIQVDRAIRLLMGNNNKVIPRIFINLENDIEINQDYNSKRRRNCRVCGVNNG